VNNLKEVKGQQLTESKSFTVLLKLDEKRRFNGFRVGGKGRRKKRQRSGMERDEEERVEEKAH